MTQRRRIGVVLNELFAPIVRLMNRLKYPQKFLLVGLVLVLPLGIVLSQYIAQSNIVIDFAAKEQLGLAYNTPLVAFLQDVEQYAGLIYANSEGDDAFKAKLAPTMAQKQSEVEDDIRAMDGVQEKLGQRLAIGTRWDDIKSHWNAAQSSPSVLTRHLAAI